MYVGITRARRHLTITRVKSRAKYGQRAPCLPSRFLFEIKGETPPFALPQKVEQSVVHVRPSSSVKKIVQSRSS